MLLRLGTLRKDRTMTDHVQYACPGDHDDGGWSCQFCAGGLFACDACGSFEGATTSECPGVQMTADQADAVYAGTLDFRDDAWVNGPSELARARGLGLTPTDPVTTPPSSPQPHPTTPS